MLNYLSTIGGRLMTCGLILLSKKEGLEMMAMLWAQQIILGKKVFADVPRLLRDKVAEILIDSGMVELIATPEE